MSRNIVMIGSLPQKLLVKFHKYVYSLESYIILGDTETALDMNCFANSDQEKSFNRYTVELLDGSRVTYSLQV